MQAGQPSRTALLVAIHRAAHQVLEGGVIFPDPLAMRILGADAEARVRELPDDPFSRALRQYLVVRSRIAEDALASAVERGTRQLVILGAGLDTCAYRRPPGERLRVSRWTSRPRRNGSARCSLPPASRCRRRWSSRRWISSTRPWPTGLAAAGVDRTLPTFFSWLGVVPYLTPEAFAATLRYIAAWESRTQVVFDYANAPASLTGEARAAHEGLAARVAAAGEPFRNFLDTEVLHAQLQALGFTVVEDLGPKQIAARFAPEQVPHVQERGGHILRAVTAPR